jgi:hypothetical protein
MSIAKGAWGLFQSVTPRWPDREGNPCEATPTLDQIRHALAAMPVESDIEKRDQAVLPLLS